MRGEKEARAYRIRFKLFLNLNIKATLFFLLPFFMSLTQRFNSFSTSAKKPNFSEILSTKLPKSLREDFSFDKIFHPPHRRGWLDSMVIALRCPQWKINHPQRHFKTFGTTFNWPATSSLEDHKISVQTVRAHLVEPLRKSGPTL